jgi:three-Cys-motif partner protein
MGKKHRNDHFAEFRGHTALKHGVLDRYVKAWIQILKKSHSKIWVIDGFAGKGKDDTGRPGSPLLLARSAAQLREHGADVHVLAIEPRREWYEALKVNLAPFDADAGGSVPVAHLRHGTLANVQEEVFRLVGDAPVFVFLDPFGADGLELGVVGRTLALQKGEVFALFSHQAVCRHLAVLAAERRSDHARRNVFESPSLFPDLDAEWLADELADAERSDAGLMPTKEAAGRILDELFGSRGDVQHILDLARRSWADEVTRAYLRVLERCGATHITPVGIFDADQRCAYFLIHAAKSPLAAYKMKEAIAAATSKSDLPDQVKDCIRWAHSARMDEVVAAVLREFAGKEVRWTGEPGRTDCVRGFALSETRMFCEQSNDLKVALGPHVIQKRPLRYRFPHAE